MRCYMLLQLGGVRPCQDGKAAASVIGTEKTNPADWMIEREFLYLFDSDQKGLLFLIRDPAFNPFQKIFNLQYFDPTEYAQI